MHNINNDKAPAKILNLFQKASHIHSYNTVMINHVRNALCQKRQTRNTKQSFLQAWS